MARLCALDEVPDGAARGFRLEPDDPQGLRVIVLRRGPEIRVYRNRCPHRGTPLDWMPDRFLDAAGEHLVCSTHGALFRLLDGHCVAGPCTGEGLEALPFELSGGAIHLRDT